MHRSRWVAAAASALALLATGVGCGTSSTERADKLLAGAEEPQPLEAEQRLVEAELVNDADVRKAPKGSARRAFLEYWNSISFEDWRGALAAFAPELRNGFQPGYLVQALRAEGAGGIPVKPVIRSAVEGKTVASIRYNIRAADGKLRPTSSSWALRGTRWRLVYSATLDDSYAGAVQAGVQTRTNPTGTDVTDAAVRAGEAARRTQAGTLRFDERPSPTP